jgi:hypothetical protein
MKEEPLQIGHPLAPVRPGRGKLRGPDGEASPGSPGRARGGKAGVPYPLAGTPRAGPGPPTRKAVCRGTPRSRATSSRGLRSAKPHQGQGHHLLQAGQEGLPKEEGQGASTPPRPGPVARPWGSGGGNRPRRPRSAPLQGLVVPLPVPSVQPLDHHRGQALADGQVVEEQAPHPAVAVPVRDGSPQRGRGLLAKRLQDGARSSERVRATWTKAREVVRGLSRAAPPWPPGCGAPPRPQACPAPASRECFRKELAVDVVDESQIQVPHVLP